MTCGVVAISISGCDVCTACRVVCDCSPSYIFVLWGQLCVSHFRSAKLFMVQS